LSDQTLPQWVRKREGALVPFDPGRIESAIQRALDATPPLEVEGRVTPSARTLTQDVIDVLRRRGPDHVPSVEEIQDIVEETLIHRGLTAAAKAYILYRHRRASLREAKALFGVRNGLKLSLNAVRVLERRYLLRDDQGHVIETPAGMFERVGHAVAEAELRYGGEADRREWEERFAAAMSALDFLPNSPTLMNAGTRLGQLSACFVLPVEDSMDGIFGALHRMARIHQTGGGTGFSFSRLRPRGDIVGSTHGVASGPVSFMSIFDVATEVVKQGGKRRGANMGVLRVDHPNIVEFIKAKTRGNFLRNFNLSVAVTDEFLRAVREDRDYPLINPRTGAEVQRLSARGILDLCANAAWETGDPGLIFIDVINRHNPTPHLGPIEATNPCGELPLLPYESCNLGSINLARFVDATRTGQEGVEAIQWERLRQTVHLAVRFLDDVIDVNRYVLPEIELMTRGNRKIGLGLMGFADLLIKLGIPYDSEEARALAERLMRFLSEEGRRASMSLAEQRGVFPNWKGSIWEGKGMRVRNATVTTIAPTGTISIIAGCSSGIEPIFAVSFVRNVMEGARLLEVQPDFERIARERGFYTSERMMTIARRGSVRGLAGIPEDVQRIFATAFDISPGDHVRVQAAFQKYCDNSVSKTVNLPASATPETVRKIFLLAYELGCKGVTVYRYGSRAEQVLTFPAMAEKAPADLLEPATASAEYAGGCPEPQCIY